MQQPGLGDGLAVVRVSLGLKPIELHDIRPPVEFVSLASTIAYIGFCHVQRYPAVCYHW